MLSRKECYIKMWPFYNSCALFLYYYFQSNNKYVLYVPNEKTKINFESENVERKLKNYLVQEIQKCQNLYRNASN